MPELPEVQTVRNSLSKLINNSLILDVKLNSDKSLRNKDKLFLKKLKGQTIKSFDSKGKNLIMNLDDYFIVLHLRMEGKFFKLPLEDNSINKHNIITFIFKENKLLFNDHRRFATIDIFENETELNNYLDKVGPEPWDINIDTLYEQIKNKKTPIKSTLLDQKYISGLGNIYVDEVLFESKVLPTRKTNLVTKKELNSIIKNSCIIFKESIKCGGTTISTFQSHGVDGTYQNKLKVHTRKGKECPNGKLVEKTIVGGRGTYYCPGYQK